MLMCSSFPDDILGAGAEPKGETNEPKVKKKIYTVLIKNIINEETNEKLIYNQLMTLRQANESEPNLGSRFWH